MKRYLYYQTSMQPTLSNIIENRHCKRSFLSTPISKKKKLESIIQTASHAASSKNTQPWQVAILTNKTKNNLVDLMCTKFENNEFEDPDYTYSINPMPQEFKNRARECGHALYKLKGIDHHNKQDRLDHFKENFTFFNAPVAMIFHLPKSSERGNF